MEDDAARSEPGIEPVLPATEYGGHAAEKLRQLEEEIARLKKQIEPGAMARTDVAEQQDRPLQTDKADVSDQSEATQTVLTPQEQAEIEALVKQAQLAKIRKQNSVATKLLRQAADRAPGSVIVLEALGDDLMERKMYNGAAETYAKAIELDPANVALERKHADAVYYGQAAGLGLELEDDTLASPKARIFLAMILPGIGQMVRGALVKGAIILAGFVTSLVVMGMMYSTQEKGSALGGKFGFVIPLAFALIFWLWGILDASAGRKDAPHRIDRPKPPVDLPFE